MNNYSGTRCPYCEKVDVFELVEDTPKGSEEIETYLRCKSCYKFLGTIGSAKQNNLLSKLFQIIERFLNKF
jgi:DNA-directed RNA polymerase subunit RPC12/RpoP